MRWLCAALLLSGCFAERQPTDTGLERRITALEARVTQQIEELARERQRASELAKMNNRLTAISRELATLSRALRAAETERRDREPDAISGRAPRGIDNARSTISPSVTIAASQAAAIGPPVANVASAIEFRKEWGLVARLLDAKHRAGVPEEEVVALMRRFGRISLSASMRSSNLRDANMRRLRAIRSDARRLGRR